MLKKSKDQAQPQTDLFKPLFMSMINPKYELVVLSERIKWGEIEIKLKGYYSNFGCPARPIRMMVVMLLLKQMFNKSDEVIVEEWI
jgi:IS5 family transposase